MPWMSSAHGPKQIAGMPRRTKWRASVVAVVARSAARAPWTMRVGVAQREHDRLVARDRRALAAEAVVADGRAEPSGGAGDRVLDAALQVGRAPGPGRAPGGRTASPRPGPSRSSRRRSSTPGFRLMGCSSVGVPGVRRRARRSSSASSARSSAQDRLGRVERVVPQAARARRVGRDAAHVDVEPQDPDLGQGEVVVVGLGQDRGVARRRRTRRAGTAACRCPCTPPRRPTAACTSPASSTPAARSARTAPVIATSPAFMSPPPRP